MTARRAVSLLEALVALSLALVLISTAAGLLVVRAAELQDAAGGLRARQALLDARERLAAGVTPLPEAGRPRTEQLGPVTLELRRAAPDEVAPRLRLPGLAVVVLTATHHDPDGGTRRRTLTVLIDRGGGA